MDAGIEFIYSFEGEQRKIMLYLHNLLTAQPEVISKTRFKVPFYYRKSWICYINPQKDNSIELCFLRGNELSNANGLLDARGRKQVAGLMIARKKDIPEAALLETLQEALLLDEKEKYASKRKYKK